MSARLRWLPVPLLLGAVVWFTPPPEGLAQPAWRIFAIFAATILAILLDALPVLTAAILALAISVLSGALTPEAAYAGFHQSVILLIVVAFLVARTVVTSGL